MSKKPKRKEPEFKAGQAILYYQWGHANKATVTRVKDHINYYIKGDDVKHEMHVLDFNLFPDDVFGRARLATRMRTDSRLLLERADALEAINEQG
jgi:hypothetical protein